MTDGGTISISCPEVNMVRRFLRASILMFLAASAFAAPTVRRSSTIAITSDGRLIVTANPDSRSVSVIDAASRTVVAEVNVNGTPQTVAIAPGDARVFVPTREGSVAVVDLAPPRLATSISVGAEAFGAVCDDAHFYVSLSGAS